MNAIDFCIARAMWCVEANPKIVAQVKQARRELVALLKCRERVKHTSIMHHTFELPCVCDDCKSSAAATESGL
jgi:hypothetical protein